MSGKNIFGFNSTDIKLDEQMPWKISDVIFTYIFIFVLSLIITGILLYVSFDINMGLFTALFQLAISFITLGVIYLIVTRKYRIPFKEAFGIDFEQTPYFLKLGTLTAITIIIATASVNFAFSQMNGTTEQSPYSFMSEDKIKAIIFLAVFVAPIVEEIFFRGFMQPALVKTIGVLPGIFFTALIFGMSHTQYLDYSVALISVTAIGLILGTVKYMTNSVIPGIFAHLLNNLLAVMSLLSGI